MLKIYLTCIGLKHNINNNNNFIFLDLNFFLNDNRTLVDIYKMRKPYIISMLILSFTGTQTYIKILNVILDQIL